MNLVPRPTTFFGEVDEFGLHGVCLVLVGGDFTVSEVHGNTLALQ